MCVVVCYMICVCDMSVVCHFPDHCVSFTYDVSTGREFPSLQDYKYGVEFLFISLLAKSKFATKVSDEQTTI